VFTIAEPRTATEAAAQLAARLLARRLRSFATLAVLVLGLLTWSEDGDARAEGGSGLAAKDALGFSRLAPLDNSLPANAAPPTYPGGSHGGSFNRPGLVGGFAAGFLGTGVVGLLFGHGMFGGLSGFPAVLGLLFQLSLLAMLARLIWSWWRVGSVATVPDLSPRQLADAYERSRNVVLPDIDMDYDGEAGKEVKKIVRR